MLNREEATKLKNSEIFNAFIEGKELEYFYEGSWDKVVAHLNIKTLLLSPSQYRIKPKEPRRFWINRFKSSLGYLDALMVFASKDTADLHAQRCSIAEQIEVVEVLK